MEKTIDNIAEKYEERFIRRLGEIAILIHLVKSPEGSHAYEMRSRASEIIFEGRKKGVEFLKHHLEILLDMKELFLSAKDEILDYTKKEKDLRKKLDFCPIFLNNVRIQKFFSEDYQILLSDIDYIDEIIQALKEAIQEMQEQAVIWSNISGIYPAIESLEKNGLIKLDREDPEGGRLKKIYVITDLGRESLSRVMASLLDISSFVLETEGRNFLSGERSIFSPRLVPFRKIFNRLTEDLSLDFKKKMLSFNGKPPGRPFIRMMMDQGIAIPRLNVLIRHPEMIKQHLEKIKDDEEKKMVISFLKTKLEEQKKAISKILNELD